MYKTLSKGVMSQRIVTRTVDRTKFNPNTYYQRVFRAASKLRDYHAWRNAHLLQQKFADLDEPVRVFTDTLRVSLKRLGEAERFQYMKVLLSVVETNRTNFILAAHVVFLPDKKRVFS